MKFDRHSEDKNYNYLIKMPMDSVSYENVQKLMKEHNDKELELENVKNITIHNMWLNELKVLKTEYNKFLEEDMGYIKPENKKVKGKR